tara:strand:- start:1253 stop:1864 length:612 start_codon:yes stop_codon:yes gene_type:complete
VRKLPSELVRILYKKKERVCLIVEESFGKFSIGDMIIVNNKLQLCEEIQSTLPLAFAEKRAFCKEFLSPRDRISISVDLETYSIFCASDLATKFLGYEKSELIGMSILDIYDMKNMKNADMKSKTEVFLREGKVSFSGLVVKKKCGKRMKVKTYVVSIKNTAGRIVNSLSTWIPYKEGEKNGKIKQRKKDAKVWQENSLFAGY